MHARSRSAWDGKFSPQLSKLQLTMPIDGAAGAKTTNSDLQHLDTNAHQLEAISVRLRDTVSRVFKEGIPKMERRAILVENELAQWKIRARKAEEKVEALEKSLANAERRGKDMAETLDKQSFTLSWIGAVMGEMLWKTCKQHESVRALLQTGTMTEFLKVANKALESFGHTFEDDVPPPESNDYKFMASICGTLTNFAAFPEGRSYLAKQTDGLIFAGNLLQTVRLFPMPKGHVLRRMSLTYVYNVSLEDGGARFILRDETRLGNVFRCLDQQNSSDVLALTVGLIVRLINASDDANVKGAILRKIPMPLVRKMGSSTNPQLQEASAHLLDLFEVENGPLVCD